MKRGQKITEINVLKMQAARMRKQGRIKQAVVYERRLQEKMTARLKWETKRAREAA